MTGIDQGEALAALALRVEQATGPDRELDAMVWASTVAGYIEGTSIWYEDNGWVKTAVSLGDGMVRERKRLGDTRDAPAFTASLDAAVTLVPEDHDIQITQGAGEQAAAIVVPSDQVATDERYAATPALALCAAALLALREHIQSNMEGERG